MLDPFNALSLASAAVQFVDFGTKLVSTGHDIYKSVEGAATENLEIEAATSIVQSLAARFVPATSTPSKAGHVAGRLNQAAASVDATGIRQGLVDSLAAQMAHAQTSADVDVTPLVDNTTYDNDVVAGGIGSRDFAAHDHDERLPDLARMCLALARELLDALNNLKVQQSGRLRTFSAIRQALRAALKADKIKVMQGRLDSIRLQINTSLSFAVRAQQESITRSLLDVKKMGSQMHLETQADLQELRSTLVAKFQLQQDYLQTMQERAKISSEEHMAAIRSCQDLLDMLSPGLQMVAQQDTEMAKMEALLESLQFPEMLRREEAIHDAHAQTFSWIFDEGSTAFKSWLEHGTGIFWVNGKAGSGKSTLMKYLNEHNRTSELLQNWASDQRIITARFYFYHAGHPMQKTQQGLLQSLLYQILRQCPQLIPKILSRRWDILLSSRWAPLWTRTEVLEAFALTLHQKYLPVRFCFFIDGLDEYLGDRDELIRDLDSIIANGTVKLCVSSRPWNVFRNRYGTELERQLVLQDLTKSDMDCYIRDLLEKDYRFAALAVDSPDAQSLTTEIREKADGVFLWVFLVVRSLLQGLTEDDDIAILQKRLRALPSNLKAYFRLILDSIDDIYRPYTCRALQLAVSTKPLPLLVYWYIPKDMETPDFALNMPIEALQRKDAKNVHQKVISMVNKWCKDFLEIRKTKRGHIENPLLNYEVTFMHRTVRDFLAEVNIQGLTCGQEEDTFSPWTPLVRLHLAHAKAFNFSNIAVDGALSGFVELAEDTMKYAKQCEVVEGQTPYHILKEFDKVGHHHLNKRQQGHWTNAVPRLSGEDWISAHSQGSFLDYAMRHELVLFVAKEQPPPLKSRSRLSTNVYTPHSNLDREYKTLEEIMLDVEGSNVNFGSFEVDESASAWNMPSWGNMVGWLRSRNPWE